MAEDVNELRNLPIVKAVPIVRLFQFQTCALLVLSMVLVAVAKVIDESAEPPPPFATHEVTPAVVLEST
jgi:hypothetical protein